MADKRFGVRELIVLGSGTPKIQSPNNLNLSAVNVAISTNATVGGTLDVTGISTFNGNVTLGTNVSNIVTFNADIASALVPDNNSTLGIGSSSARWGTLFVDNVNATGVLTATSFQGNSIVGDGSDRGFATKYYITANSSSAYRFAGPGSLNTDDNPTLYFYRGFTYILENSTGSGHPFELRVNNGGAAYNPGGSFLTGSINGTQILTVPFDAPNSIVYQCTLHSGMVGTINFVT